MAMQVQSLVANKPCYEKEFIDFEFAGKHIGEFDMVAVVDGDRYSSHATAPFDDLTTEINGVDGQYYWGSRYKAYEYSYSLATDGITEKTWQQFKNHFQPGKYGTLHECTYIGRSAQARVNSQPEFKFVAFQKQVEIGGKTIMSNLYKGEITLTFILDTPWWTADTNVINKNFAAVDQGELREMYHSGIPAQDKLGGVNAGNDDEVDWDELFYNPSNIKTPASVSVVKTHTAPSTITVPTYLTEFGDDINLVGYDEIYCDGALAAYYTAPNFFYSINRAIQMIAEMETNISLTDFEETLRNEVLDPIIMSECAKYINMCIAAPTSAPEELATITGTDVKTWSGNWKLAWNKFLLHRITNNSTVTLIMDGRTSSSNFSCTYNSLVEPEDLISGNWTQTTKTILKKNCGEVMLSKYLFIDGGDSLGESAECVPTHSIEMKRNDNAQTPLAYIKYNYLYV